MFTDLNRIEESLFVIDSTGKVIDCNEKFKILYGYKDITNLYIQDLLFDFTKIDINQEYCCGAGIDFCTCFTQEVSIFNIKHESIPSILVMIKTSYNDKNLFICLTHKKEDNIDKLDRIKFKSINLIKRLQKYEVANGYNV